MSELKKRKIGMVPVVLTAFLLAGLWGCQTAYYGMWEKLGKEKRHLLKDHVEEARDEQAEASEDFKDALTRIKEIYKFSGGELEDQYKRLSKDYEDCVSRAEAVDERIEEVESIAGDLFEEWDEEIDQIKNPTFKADSRKQLKETRRRYERLDASMTAAQSKMAPVLERLNDYVLYLKHNLNAQAIGALSNEVAGIESEVANLIRDIDRSIQEADAFIQTLD
jgi:chromosome segregation ATPase